MKKLFWSLALFIGIVCSASLKAQPATTNNAIGTTPKATLSTPMEAESSTMKVPTTGTVSTKKEKPSCPNGPLGNVIAPT